MDDYRRRRRLDAPQEPKGGLPIIPLIIVVLLLGLGLGKVLAVFFGGGGASQPTVAPTFTPLPSAEATVNAKATPSPSISPSPSASPSPSITPSASPSSSPSAKPTASAKPSPSPTASPTPRPSVILITPSPKSKATPTVAATSTPAPATATPAPALITGDVTAGHAAAIVRSYLSALASGNDAFATGYLRTGLPTETFVTKGARISNIQSTQTGNGAFNVTALIESAAGTYNESFTVQAGPQGMQITDHVPVKVP